MQIKKILILKSCSAAAVFLVSLIFALYPILSRKFKSSKVFMGIANSFAGGIFLAAGLLHMLPEADHRMRIGLGLNYDNGPKGMFPFSYLAAIFSFSFILFIDRIIFGH